MFGSAVMGYGDLFVAGVLGGLLATDGGPRAGSCTRAALTALLALGFDLLFFFVDELPATVPVALTLLVLLAARRWGLTRIRTGPRRAGAGGRDRRRTRTRSPAALGSCSSARLLGLGLQPRGDGARGGLDRRGRGDLALGGGARLLDTPYLGDHAVVERADRLVVGAHGRVELAADLGQRLDEAAEPAVQLARGLGDLARGLGDQLLAPAVVHGAQQADQRGGGGHQHLLVDPVLDQRRVLGERGLVDAVGGHEHHDELGRRVELVLVALGRRAW